jgi:hypothetical protein
MRLKDMSAAKQAGGKGETEKGKQPVAREQRTASQGATDAQIADALRQGLPHLTDASSLQDQSFGKQPQGIDVQSEQGKKDYEQKKRTRTTSQATQTQPLLLATDAFAVVLEDIPAEDWCRTWADDRTIMLRRTSKRVKEVVDKMHLPAFVHLSRSFWGDTPALF